MIRVLTVALSAVALLAATRQAKAAVGHNRYYATATIAANQVKTALDVTCNEAAGETVLGGGWYSDSRHLFVYRSRQNAEFGWRIGARNTDSTYQHSVTVWVTCATNDANDSSYASTVNVEVPAKHTRCGTAECTGYPYVFVSGGGFSSSSNSPSDLVPVASYPEKGAEGYQRWTSCFYNPSTVARTFTAYATCMESLNAYLYTVEGGNTAIAAQGTTTATVQCAAGGYAVAGGFLNAGGFGLGRVFETNRSGTLLDYWLVTTYNGQQATHAITTVPIVRCMDPD